jgi:LPXTG-motif cell wall-anchored protein
MRWRRLASRLPLTGVAASARTLAIIGLIVGALGLLAGIVALVRAADPQPRLRRPPPLRTRRCDRTGNGRQGRQL